jgi:hypothetical protein
VTTRSFSNRSVIAAAGSGGATSTIAVSAKTSKAVHPMRAADLPPMNFIA